jgi:hypothetical protein
MNFPHKRTKNVLSEPSNLVTVTVKRSRPRDWQISERSTGQISAKRVLTVTWRVELIVKKLHGK